MADLPEADLIVLAGEAVTMNPAREVLEQAAVVIRGGEIVAIEPAGDCRAAHPHAEVLDASDGLVMPGLVDAHQHLTGDRLVRSSIPDDLPPGASIFEWAVPAHAAHTEADDRLTATLACAEAVANGVTTVAEAGTVAHPHAVAAGMREVGVRGLVGRWGWDVDDAPFAAPAPEVLAAQAELVDSLADEALVGAWVTLVGHDLMSDDLVVGASELARRTGSRLTFHISPGPGDAEQYLARTGRRPLVHLDALGALGDHVVLGHAVHLDDAEVDAVVAAGCSVAYCPLAYLRLGQGVAAAGRHRELWQRGVAVGLGCDSENAGDMIDVLAAARAAAGIAKDAALDPTVFGAHDALEMATIGGARALGLDAAVGSIEVGKRADLVVHDLSGPNWVPRGSDPALELVWGTDGRSVRDVVIDGRVVVRNGRVETIDPTTLRETAVEARAALLRRSGIEPPSRWPRRRA